MQPSVWPGVWITSRPLFSILSLSFRIISIDISFSCFSNNDEQVYSGFADEIYGASRLWAASFAL